MSPTTYAVAARISVDGAQLDDLTEGYVEEVVVDEHVGLPAMFAITMLDPTRDILDTSGLRHPPNPADGRCMHPAQRRRTSYP